MSKMSLLVLSNNSKDPAARYRIFQFQGFFKQIFDNVHIIETPKCNSTFYTQLKFCIALFKTQRTISTVLISRSIIDKVLLIPVEIALLAYYRLMRKKIIFDFDDALFVSKIGWLDTIVKIKASTTVVVGSPYLYSFAKKHSSRVRLIPTVVDTDKFTPSNRSITDKRIRIGWSGSEGPRLHHLPLLRSILIELAKQRDFEFVVVSDEDPQLDWLGVNTQYIQWSEDCEVSSLQSFDIGLMPLRDSPFERGKCGFKLITYGAVGIPSVASDVGVNSHIIQHEVTGYIASNDKQWVDCLTLLIDDSQIRKKMGIEARNFITANYSLREGNRKWSMIFNNQIEAYDIKE